MVYCGVIGEVIGNFRIVSQLGRGGMGEVFLAEQLQVKTKVAIKLLLPDISADKAHVERFFNEAVAVSKIAHAGIVKIFDVGFHSDGQAYLVMEYLNGETLSSRIKRSNRLPLGQASEIGRQISSILDATHKAGITHRDRKPDNVFLVPDSEVGERVKILDFGIAKLSGNSGVTVTSGGAMGTAGYMSPEQWKNAKNVDWRTDAYALGCLAFEMACGRPPFLADSIGEACAKHLTEAPPLAHTLEPTLAGPFSILVARLLEKSPEMRPSSMKEIANTFAAIGGHPLEPSTFASSPQLGNIAVAQTKLSFAQKKRNPWMLGGAATVLIGAAALIAFIESRGTPHSNGNLPIRASSVVEPAASASLLAAAPAIVDAAVVQTADAAVPRMLDAALAPDAAELPAVAMSNHHQTTRLVPAIREVEPAPPIAVAVAEAVLPVALDRIMIANGIAKAKARVVACGDQFSATGTVKVSVKVGSDGQTTSATVTSTDLSENVEGDAPKLGHCVEAAMKRAIFARTQNGGAFAYPFSF